MRKLSLSTDGKLLRVLCLGAHSDDLEIGCAGTLLRWLSDHHAVEIVWVVASAIGERAKEARASARSLLRKAKRVEIVLGDLHDGYMPADFDAAKSLMMQVRELIDPDVILTHRTEDLHQDHRLIGELTWQIWRDHLILEYEIPKYEGDFGQPNVFVPLSAAVARRKVDHLQRHFGTQRSKSWFNADTFSSVMHLRGMQCRAPSGMAEAFHVRKAVL